ncbi:MAG: hypothetical protein ACD_58C00265G0004 [uncultured bacterium]|nr:MAG: hypothetical protein ACD_58C00265G0004 [uncultured bacterium]
MKILVTGGAGYIGSHTVKELLANGDKVVVFDNLSYGHKHAIPKKAKFIKGDLKNQKLIEKVLKREKIEAVFHFAGFIQVGESVKQPLKYYKNNFYNGINLLEAMKFANVKYIIFSSSAGVYGQPKKMPIAEGDPKDPINTYGRTKLMFEYALKSYDEAYDIKFIALRFFNAAGASSESEIGEDHSPETHIIPLIIQAALGQRDEFKIFGNDYKTPDGTCVRDYIHVEDIAMAHLQGLRYLRQKNKSNIYNIGIGKGFSNLELVETVKKVSEVDFKVSYMPRREGDPDELVADSSRAREMLNWTPKYDTIESIIKTAYDWHEKHPKGFK